MPPPQGNPSAAYADAIAEERARRDHAADVVWRRWRWSLDRSIHLATALRDRTAGIDERLAARELEQLGLWLAFAATGELSDFWRLGRHRAKASADAD